MIAFSSFRIMFKILRLIILISWRAIVINNPMIIRLLFGQLLVLASCLVGCLCPFIGLMMFLVYIGGIMILISYCVILIPSYKIPGSQSLAWLMVGRIGFIFTLDFALSGTFSYGLLFSRSAVLLLGILLYLVILAVVNIIDYSSGIIKMFYVKN